MDSIPGRNLPFVAKGSFISSRSIGGPVSSSSYTKRIGENGHIAFNDPPADFETEEPYLIVNLDEACRRQQVGEAWFADISQVPKQALSMSVKQILKAKEILAVVPDTRKAQAVKACFEGEISPMEPASILRRHPNATIYLDENSSALLSSSLRTYA